MSKKAEDAAVIVLRINHNEGELVQVAITDKGAGKVAFNDPSGGDAEPCEAGDKAMLPVEVAEDLIERGYAKAA